MDINLQSKLLRAIQEREIDRVGGTKPIKVDIRILATSNRDMEAEVKKGNFREDLFYRLNVISLNLPKLADRIDDIPPLAEYFIEKYSKANGLPVRRLSQEALAKLKSHNWPGNVRELENMLHRAVLMAQGNIIEEQAILLPGGKPLEARNQPAEIVPIGGTAAPKRNDMVGRTVEDVERELILDTLDYCLGNRTQAAQILGISIRTLRNKLKTYSDDTGGKVSGVRG
jgi:two-component system response regulator FlrC